MSASHFDPSDVLVVARALLENAISRDVESPGGRNSYNECNYCRGHVHWNQDSETIMHEATCPVLVARDLLTGAPDEKTRR